jgi:hypothetical protein
MLSRRPDSLGSLSIQSIQYHVTLLKLSYGLPRPIIQPSPTYKETVSPPRGSTVSATSH